MTDIAERRRAKLLARSATLSATGSNPRTNVPAPAQQTQTQQLLIDPVTAPV